MLQCFRFCSFSVPLGTSKRRKAEVIKQLSQQIDMPEHKVQQTKRINVKLPLSNEHTGHILTAQAASGNHIHPAVKEKLYAYVAVGITSTPMMRRLLRQFVNDDLSLKEHVDINKLDRAYFPTSRYIRNYIHSAVVADNILAWMRKICKRR